MGPMASVGASGFNGLCDSDLPNKDCESLTTASYMPFPRTALFRALWRIGITSLVLP